jgi:hypothetical protein
MLCGDRRTDCSTEIGVRVEAIPCRNSPQVTSRLDPRLLVLAFVDFLPRSEMLSVAALLLGCL